MPDILDSKPSNFGNAFKYNYALVSRISRSFETESNFDLKTRAGVDVDKARDEFEQFVKTLHKIIDVIELPCDELHPDGVFVNDVAVVLNGTALICNPPPVKGRPSRDGELAVIRQVLKKELGLKVVEVSTAEKAHVEGSDVLWTGRELFVGLSTRTNMLGAQEIARAFPEYPCTTVTVHPPAIHLKDCISMAGPEIMAVSKSEHAQKTFKEIQKSGAQFYEYITVEEDLATNVIYCNDTLVHLSSAQIPKGYAVYENRIGYSRAAITMEEALKRGCGLGSCVLLVDKVKNPKQIQTTL